MSAKIENKVSPADFRSEDLERLERLEQILKSDVKPVLCSPGGEPVPLPKRINDILYDIVLSMRSCQTVFLVHENEPLTTQAAANYLGISRQFLVRLIEKGELACEYVGTHRRLRHADLRAYALERSDRRKKLLDEMTDIMIKKGHDDDFIPVEHEDEG